MKKDKEADQISVHLLFKVGVCESATAACVVLMGNPPQLQHVTRTMRYDLCTCQYKYNPSPFLYALIPSKQVVWLFPLNIVCKVEGHWLMCVCVSAHFQTPRIRYVAQAVFFSRPLCESLEYTATTEIHGVDDHHIFTDKTSLFE